MPIITLHCERCNRSEDELVSKLDQRPVCPVCEGPRVKHFAEFTPIIPAWMRDENRAGNVRMKEYLASPEGKKADLNRTQ